MKIALRNYRADDFDTLHRIDQSCYSSEIAYSRAELRRYLAFPGANCIVAEILNNNAGISGQRQGPIESLIVGFCISIHRGAEAHIITMDVLKEWRRHGVGSTLLGEIEERLARAGVNHVELETATDNAPGIAFWRKNGYRPCGVKRGYYPRGVDAYAMVKALAAVRSP
ncbi:MAG TPA: N-acetyltransferase [Candidatus Acidoferrales bacterium]|nr:N-acetyltransferase [Candidatus Acidoferrales bacterium]